MKHLRGIHESAPTAKCMSSLGDLAASNPILQDTKWIHMGINSATFASTKINVMEQILGQQ
jgi:hypothetical protein